MKRILGLDLGTNSIGWAVLKAEQNESDDWQLVGIEAAGSRIIPMDAATLGDFDRGNSISQTAERTRLRGMRHLLERCLLRRERLHRVLDILGFLPLHYSQALNRYGQIKEGEEPKLAWRKNGIGKYEFLFVDSFNEMLEDFNVVHPELVGKKIPYDWTIYYLRKKALTQKISKEELAWLLLNFNQKRGYYQLSDEEEENDNNTTIESLKVVDVVKKEKDKKSNKYWFDVHLENGWIYSAPFFNDIYSWKFEIKDFIVKTTVLKNGTSKQSLSVLPSVDEIEKMTEKEKNKLYSKIRLKTEKNIADSGKTVGTYIYDSILHNPSHYCPLKIVDD